MRSYFTPITLIVSINYQTRCTRCRRRRYCFTLSPTESDQAIRNKYISYRDRKDKRWFRICKSCLWSEHTEVMVTLDDTHLKDKPVSRKRKELEVI